MGQDEGGNLWSAVGSAEEEEAGCGRTWRVSREKVWRVVGKRNEKVEAVVEGRLGLLEVGVARLHVVEEAGGTGALAVTGQGWEAGGQSGLVGVEGLEQSPAEEAGVPVGQVEVVEVQQLLCSLPF